MDEMKIIEAKTMRGDIITKLYLTYGTDIRVGSLRNALRSRGFVDEKELLRGINYLEDKKYVSIERNQDNWMDSMIQLTGDGVNLAEGDRPDEKGVIINE